MPDATNPEVQQTIQQISRLMGEGEYAAAWEYAFTRASYHGMRGHSSIELYLQFSAAAHKAGQTNWEETFKAVAQHIAARHEHHRTRFVQSAPFVQSISA